MPRRIRAKPRLYDLGFFWFITEYITPLCGGLVKAIKRVKKIGIKKLIMVKLPLLIDINKLWQLEVSGWQRKNIIKAPRAMNPDDSS